MSLKPIKGICAMRCVASRLEFIIAICKTAVQWLIYKLLDYLTQEGEVGDKPVVKRGA